MIISFDTEKAVDKIPHPLIIRVLERLRIQGIHLIILKAIYSKPIANIKSNGKKLKAMPLKSGTRQGCAFIPNLFSIVFEVSGLRDKTNKGDQGDTNWKGRS